MRRVLLAHCLALALAHPAGAQSSRFLSREAEARIGAEEPPKVRAQFGGALGAAGGQSAGTRDADRGGLGTARPALDLHAPSRS
jgi:hypothetical protein